MKYVIWSDSEFLTKSGDWSSCYHDSLDDIKWGEDLEEIKIFANKEAALKKVKSFPHDEEREYILVPIREMDAIEILRDRRIAVKS